MIDEDLDVALGKLSLETRKSKAALIREFVRANVEAAAPLEDDPLWQMVGADHYEPVPIDDVVYA